MKHNFTDYVESKRREYGERFSDSKLSRKFVRYYENGERIKVRTFGMEMTGTIGVTTGWLPCFLLMRTSRSIGSPWTLSDDDEIIAVKRGATYRPL